MLRFSRPSLGVLLCVLMCAVPSFAQGVNPAGGAVSRDEAEKWREDLRYMAREMEARHKNLFHAMTREQFEGAVRRLNERIPALARHQIIVELMRIAALVSDGDTNVAPTRDPKIGFRTLPVKLYLFRDGMFVRAAERSHAGLLGARVLKIGDLAVEEAVARARRQQGAGREESGEGSGVRPEALRGGRAAEAVEAAVSATHHSEQVHEYEDPDVVSLVHVGVRLYLGQMH